MAEYIYLVDVKSTAPENYRPRTSTYRGVAIGDNPRKGELVKEKAISIVKQALEEQNPGVPLKFKATVEVRKSVFFIDSDKLNGIETVRIPLEVKDDGCTKSD